MRKILPILLAFVILYTLPLTAYSVPVGVIYEHGSVYDGGQIYFIYVNLKEGDAIKDSYYLALFKGDYFNTLPLSQLRADLNDQWLNHADKENIIPNTLMYSRHGSLPEAKVIDESYSVSQAVMYAANNLLNIPNTQISSTAYLDNRTVLSQNIANEDNHAQYDRNTNTLILNYTFDITEKTVYLDQDGTTNEYLQKTYNSVQYRIVCMLVELKAVAVTTPAPTPAPTPYTTPQPSPSPSAVPTLTPTTTPTPSPTQTPSTSALSSPLPSPVPSASASPSETPTETPEPEETVAPKIPERKQDKYDDIWTYIILQSLIILIIVIIILSTRRRKH